MGRYTYKRSYDWSPDIAYCVGLMASDACLRSDGRHLEMTSVDLEQVQNFVTAMGRKLHVGTKSSGAGRFAYRVQFSDVAFFDFLQQVGLTPNKSKTMPALHIPDSFFNDFLRGLFDGDGSTYGYFDNRWRSSFMFYVQYASASLEFLIYLRETLIRLFVTKGGAINLSKGAYILSYAKADSYLLYDAMYYSGYGLALTRKCQKLEGFIEYDKTVIMRRNARVVELVDTQP